MKVIRKDRNVCSFGDLDSGDVFKLSETGHLFILFRQEYSHLYRW